MKGKAELREMLYRVLASTYRYAERVVVIDYPHSIDRRSIDMAVMLRNNKVLLVKVTLDLKQLPKNEAAELSSVASTFNVPAIITALYNRGSPLIDGVVYEKMGLLAVSPDTLEGVLSGSEQLYVYASKESFKVKVNPEKLRERRTAMNMSLGHVASYLGVSRKAVYEYEKGSMDPTVDKAEKLVRLFGEDILDEIDIFNPPKPLQRESLKPSTIEEARLADELAMKGLNVVHTRRTATDVIAASKKIKITAIVERQRESLSTLVERAEYAAKLAEAVDAETIALVRRGEASTELEALGFESIKRPHEASEILRKLLEDE